MNPRSPRLTGRRAVLATVLLLLVVGGSGGAQAPAIPPADAPAIRLVLLVAADQFRYDYLTRFRHAYRHGFDTLLTRGAVFTDAHLEHANTVTAVGHSTMLTGAVPAVSGIIGNSWFDRTTGGSVTSVSDPSSQMVGATGEASSPHRLLVSTIGDEVRIASQTATAPRAVGLSFKDRSAILPLGRTADAAYWFDNASGTFVTSTWYRPDLPEWVSAFNARRLSESYAGRRWELPVEGGGIDMPQEPGLRLNEAVYTSPFGNEILLALAKDALAYERLGQRGTTDLFTVSFSSNDAVGHRYGPDSPHVRDMSVRTDAIIGELLDEVDRLVGLSRTLVIFTTDHGVAPVPEYGRELRLPGGRFAGASVNDAVQQALTARFGRAEWLAAGGSSLYLNHAVIANKKLDPVEVRRVAAAAAATVPHVARVFTREDLLDTAVPADPISRRVARSYHAQRSGDLEIVLDPYWIRGSSGTTHGSPYTYDAHIPLILMGPGVVPGHYAQKAAMNDLAPTLATLLGTASPSGAMGRVLVEALASAEHVQPHAVTR